MSSDLDRLLDEIAKEPALRTLFDSLWSNERACRLLFSHREVLFPRVPMRRGPLLPFLFLDNLPDDPMRVEAMGQVLVRTVALDNVSSEIAQEAIGDAWGEFENDVKALTCLLALRLIKKNSALRALIDGEDPSLADVKQVLATGELDWSVFDELSAVRDVLEGQGALTPGDELLTSTIGRLTEKTRDAIFANLAGFVRLLDWSSRLSLVFAAGHDHLTRLLETIDLGKDEYRRTLQDLYLGKLIRNLGTVFWCTFCHDEAFLATTPARLGPDQLRAACPKCSRPLVYGTVYQLNHVLLDAISARDGFLCVAIAKLLRAKGVRFRANLPCGMEEIDLLCDLAAGSVIIECKMHKAGKDEESVENNLRRGLGQIRKQIGALTSAGTTVSEAWLVHNYDSEEYQESLRRVSREIPQGRVPVRILPARELPRRLENALERKSLE